MNPTISPLKLSEDPEPFKDTICRSLNKLQKTYKNFREVPIELITQLANHEVGKSKTLLENKQGVNKHNELQSKGSLEVHDQRLVDFYASYSISNHFSWSIGRLRNSVNSGIACLLLWKVNFLHTLVDVELFPNKTISSTHISHDLKIGRGA